MSFLMSEMVIEDFPAPGAANPVHVLRNICRVTMIALSPHHFNPRKLNSGLRYHSGARSK